MTGQHCEIDVRFFAPPPELEGCFTTFHRVEIKVSGEGRVRDYLLPEWTNLRIFRGDRPVAHMPGDEPVLYGRFAVTGASSLPLSFELGTTRIWGVGLFPLGWAKFVAGSAADLVNKAADGETAPAFARLASLPDLLMAGPADDERERAIITEHFLKHNRPHRDEERIIAVHAALVDPATRTVSEMGERSGLNLRTLERLCYRTFGFAPKMLLRRQRFVRSLSLFMLGEAANWTAAIDEHYHDQAHFIREFRHFMGMSPGEYAELDRPIMKAFMAERARIWGSSAQTLDKPQRETMQ